MNTLHYLGVKLGALKILGFDTQLCTKHVTAQLGNCPKDQPTQPFTLRSVVRKLDCQCFVGLVRMGAGVSLLWSLHPRGLGCSSSFRVVYLYHSFPEWDKLILFSFLVWSHSSVMMWFDVLSLVWFRKVL